MGGVCWIASYPKSGNSWVRLMLDSLRAGGAAVDLSRARGFAPLAGRDAEFDAYLDVEASDLSQAELRGLRPDLALAMARDAGAPLFRKVHECWGHTAAGRPVFPPEATGASLYLVRDPRDVAVSWAHHNAWSVDATIAFMARPGALPAAPAAGVAIEQPLSSWSGHVTSWRAADPAPLVIRYEDLCADPGGWIARAARHLDLAAPSAAVAAAVAATRFETLRAAEARHGFDIGQASGRRFFRRGEAGGWRDTLTPGQAARILADHRTVMESFGYS